MIYNCSLGEIFSGKEGEKPGGEVWVSEDGLTWNLLTGQAAFGVRTRAPAAVFNSKLWLFGGANVEFALLEPMTFYDDVWSTTDGANWTEVRQNTLGNENCPECPGNMRGRYLAYAFKNCMWIYGITTNYAVYRWFYSKDGRQWTEWDSIPSNGILSGYTVFKDTLWAFEIPSNTGVSTVDQKKNSIWATEDGFKWNRILSKPAFPAISNFKVSVFQNLIWLLDRDGNEIWHSENCLQWEKVAEVPVLGDIKGADFFTFQNKLWILGEPGFDYNKNEYFNNDLWQSENGIMWKKVQTAPGFVPRRGHTIIEFQGKLWVIGGLQRY